MDALPGLPWKVGHPDPSSLEADVLLGLLTSLTDPLHGNLFKGKVHSKDRGANLDKGLIWDNLDLEIDLRIKTLQQVRKQVIEKNLHFFF